MLMLPKNTSASAVKLAEMAGEVCEGMMISSEAKSGESDWPVALRESREDRRYIRRAIVACGMAR